MGGGVERGWGGRGLAVGSGRRSEEGRLRNVRRGRGKEGCERREEGGGGKGGLTVGGGKKGEGEVERDKRWRRKGGEGRWGAFEGSAEQDKQTNIQTTSEAKLKTKSSD